MFDYTLSTADVGTRVSADATTTYYVSPSGSDANGGKDEQHPFLTPKKASDTAVGGDTVLFMDGTYSLTTTWKIRDSGTTSAAAPIVFKAQHPRQAAITGPTDPTLYGIEINGDYVILKDLVQKAAGNSGIKPKAGHITIDNCEVTGNGPTYQPGDHAGQGIGATGVDANYLTIQNSTIHHNNEHGVYIDNGVDNLQVLNNNIYNNGGWDFQVNNQGVQSGGGTSNSLIAGNRITNTSSAYGGMNLLSLQDSVVSNNLVDQNKKGISLSQSTTTIAATNNIFKHNTVIAGGDGAVLITRTSAVGNKLFNNVLVERTGGNADPIEVEAGDFAALDYNLVFNQNSDKVASRGGQNLTASSWQAAGFDTHSRFTDPKFSNQAGSDYHLTKDSPAIGLATLDYKVDTDLEGNLRYASGPLDAGAYAYYIASGGGGTITADLGISLTVDNVKPKEGDTTTYVLTVKNNGPDTATNVVANDSLPTGLAYSSATASNGSYDATSGNWTIGSLANGASATLTLKTTVNGGTNTTVITNTARVSQSSSIVDPQSNNTATVALTVTNVADMGVAMSLNNIRPRENDTVTYTLKIENFGPNNAGSVTVKDLLPTGLSYVSATPSVGTYDKALGEWTVGGLNAGVSATMSLKVSVNGGTLGKTLTNSAYVSESSSIFDAGGNNSATVSLTVAETPCTANCGGGSSEPEKSPETAPPGAGPTSSGNTTPAVPAAGGSGGVTSPSNPSGATTKKPANPPISSATANVTRLDVKKSYVRVDGDRIRANGKDRYTLVVGIKSNQDQFMIKPVPGILIGGGQSNLGEWTLIGNEWLITVTSMDPGTRSAEIKIGKISIATVSLPFLPDAPPVVKSIKDEPAIHLDPSLQPDPTDLLPDSSRDTIKEEGIHPTPIYKLWWRKIISFFARFK